MSLIDSTAIPSAASEYEIGNSLKLEADNNEWLYNASPTAGNRRTFTFSFWIKRMAPGSINASGIQYVIGQGQHGRMFFDSNDFFNFRFDDGHDVRNITRKFRDTSAWLHVVVAVDTNQVSSSNRVKIYFNGVQTTDLDFDGGSYPDIQDQSSGWFTTNYLTIGTAPFGGSYNSGDGDYDMRGYLAEFCAVDGQQLSPTDFGEVDTDSGIWKPIDVSGINFGSQGFYLDFADAADLGDDESGNGNDFTENNLSSIDQASDSPTNNFATLNLMVPNYVNTGKAEEGGTFIDWGKNSYGAWFGTQGLIKGKWFWEFYIPSRSATYGLLNYVGLHTLESKQFANGNTYATAGSNTVFFLMHYGDYYATTNGTLTSQNTAAGLVSQSTGAVGSTFGVAFNADDAEITYYKNGSVLGNAGIDTFDIDESIAAGNYVFPFFQVYDNDLNVNFGGYSSIAISSGNSDANGYGNFEYAVPSGYYAICTKNLAEFG